MMLQSGNRPLTMSSEEVARNIIALYVVPPHHGELLCDRSEEVSEYLGLVKRWLRKLSLKS